MKVLKVIVSVKEFILDEITHDRIPSSRLTSPLPTLPPPPEDKIPNSPVKLPPTFGKGKHVCKTCCCLSHHRLMEHRHKSKQIPTLAFDISEVQFTYKNQSRETDTLKKPDAFSSLDEMIWSTQLDLN